MHSSRRLVLVLAVLAAACSKREPSSDRRAPIDPRSALPAGIGTSPPIKDPVKNPIGPKGDPRPSCSFVTAEDVEAVIGSPVTGKAHASPDVCGAYAVGDQEVVIGRRDGGFDALVGAVPQSSFPVRRDIAGLGDAAVELSAGQGASPRLYVRKGDAAVYFLGSGLSGAQIEALARRVVPRL